MHSCRKKKSAGFSLIEAAIVLAIVGPVIGGIWIATSAVKENLAASRTVEGVLGTCKRALNIFKASTADPGTDETDLDSVAIRAGVLPSDWVSGSNIKAPYGGKVHMTQYQQSGADITDSDGIIKGSVGVVTIYLTGMSQRMCMKITKGLHPELKGGLPFIQVGSGSNTTHSNIISNWPAWAAFLYRRQNPYGMNALRRPVRARSSCGVGSAIDVAPLPCMRKRLPAL